MCISTGGVNIIRAGGGRAAGRALDEMALEWAVWWADRRQKMSRVSQVKTAIRAPTGCEPSSK